MKNLSSLDVLHLAELYIHSQILATLSRCVCMHTRHNAPGTHLGMHPYALYCSPSLLSLECSAIVSPISLPFCECCDSLRIGRTNHKGTHEPGSWSEFSEHNTPHDKAKSAPGMPLLLETPPSFCCPITMQLMEDPVSFGRRKWAQPSSHCMHLFRSPLARTLCRERALSLSHTHTLVVYKITRLPLGVIKSFSYT